MGTSRLKKKTKNSKREISADERANESIKKSLAELASIFRREDERGEGYPAEPTRFAQLFFVAPQIRMTKEYKIQPAT
ncbi:hypothetical protein HOLleu_32365 [Holothuria leucospilota]|uniref:Uncharacterized protein n=1 Tax=Holothuria leucospilota TaxID=206669 RepID=A0A9Q1BIK8_HOLLE|nr:hypothetical protein HOLleu_32365 [Holothuria leucospilota]